MVTVEGVAPQINYESHSLDGVVTAPADRGLASEWAAAS